MKYGHYVIHKNTACYVPKPYNLAALVEQQSDHIKMLTYKVERLEEFKHTQQHNGIEDEGNNSGTASGEISTETTIREMAKEHMPNMIKHKSVNGEREEK